MNNIVSAGLLMTMTGFSLARAAEPGRGPPDAPVLVLRGEPQIRNEDELRKLARRLPGSRVVSDGRRTVWDLRGGIIDGRHCRRFRSEQDEKNAGLNIHLPDLTICNGSIRELWGGVIFRARGGVIENMHWLDVGEDAVSTVVDRAPGFRALNCTFHNDRDGDKSIQLNDARGAVVENCTIIGGITGIRWQEHRVKARSECHARGTKFINVGTAHNVAGENTVLYLDDGAETYVGVRKKVVTNHDSRVERGSWVYHEWTGPEVRPGASKKRGSKSRRRG